jgi:hypothetical protein
MKKTIIILMVLSMSPVFSGPGSGGGGPRLGENLLSINEFTNAVQDIVWQKVKPDTLININEPERINVIKMSDGSDLSYPEVNTLIKPIDVDRVILNDGSTIKFDTTLLNPLFR